MAVDKEGKEDDDSRPKEQPPPCRRHVVVELKTVNVDHAEYLQKNIGPGGVQRSLSCAMVMELTMAVEIATYIFRPSRVGKKSRRRVIASIRIFQYKDYR